MVNLRLHIAGFFVAALSAGWVTSVTAQSPQVFAETEVNPLEVFVGEPFELRLRVLTKTWFTDGISLETPRVPLGVVRRIGRSFSYTETRNGQTYAISERRYVVWTSQTGSVTVAPQKITTASPPDGESKGVPVEVMSPEVTVKTLPPPGGVDPASWMTAQSMVIEHSWSRSLEDLKVGDAAQFEISIRAEGAIAALLHAPEFPNVAGQSVHTEPPILSDEMGDRTNAAFRTDRWTVLLQEAGTFVIPEIRIVWWNYATKIREETVIPSSTLTVAENPDLDPELASTPGANSDTLAQAAEASSWWPPSPRSLLIALLIFLAILAALRFGRRHARTDSPPTNAAEDLESAWYGSFEHAVADKDAKAIRRQFTFWLDRRLGGPTGEAETASGFARLAGDDQLRASLGHLDKDVYSKTPSATSEQTISDIAERVRNARAATLDGDSFSPKSDADGLPPLNPRA